jgi:transposase
MGRRSKYTPDVVARIVKAIELGSTYELACHYAGIRYETFRVWQEEKPAFSALVKAAEGNAVVKWLSEIEKAAEEGSWQAAAWKLERRYPQTYGRTVQEWHLYDRRAIIEQEAARLGITPDVLEARVKELAG